MKKFLIGLLSFAMIACSFAVIYFFPDHRWGDLVPYLLADVFLFLGLYIVLLLHEIYDQITASNDEDGD